MVPLTREKIREYKSIAERGVSLTFHAPSLMARIALELALTCEHLLDTVDDLRTPQGAEPERE